MSCLYSTALQIAPQRGLYVRLSSVTSLRDSASGSHVVSLIPVFMPLQSCSLLQDGLCALEVVFVACPGRLQPYTDVSMENLMTEAYAQCYAGWQLIHVITSFGHDQAAVCIPHIPAQDIQISAASHAAKRRQIQSVGQSCNVSSSLNSACTHARRYCEPSVRPRHQGQHPWPRLSMHMVEAVT